MPTVATLHPELEHLLEARTKLQDRVFRVLAETGLRTGELAGLSVDEATEMLRAFVMGWFFERHFKGAERDDNVDAVLQAFRLMTIGAQHQAARSPRPTRRRNDDEHDHVRTDHASNRSPAPSAPRSSPAPASAPLDDETFAHLHQAWVDWKVLFFRDQPVSVEEHIAFGRQFGELEIHPFLPNDGHPEIVVLDTANDGPSRAERWHTDVTFREAPPTGSILRGRIIPPVGGDTLWADMEAAYERLDDATKERIEHLTATHTLRITFGQPALARGPRTEAGRVPRPAPPGRAHPPGHRPPLAVRQRSTSSTSSTTSIPTRGPRCWPA